MTVPVRMRYQSGVALVLVLWVLVFITVLATNFASNMRVQTKITRNTIDQAQSYYVARAGIDISRAYILQRFQWSQKHTTINPDKRDLILDIKDEISDSGKTKKSKKTGKKDVTLQDETMLALWNLDGRINETELNTTRIGVSITNEASKIDLNKSPTALLKNLLRQWVLTEKEISIIIDSIDDWKDTDNLHKANGAEDDYYLSLDPPYHAKNAAFTSVEELMRVRGVGADFLMMERPIIEGRQPWDGVLQEEPVLRLVDCITVCSKDGKIDPRYASRPVLEALPTMTSVMVDRLFKLKELLGSESITMDDIRLLLGEEVYTGITNYVQFKSNNDTNYFSVISESRTTSGFVSKLKAILSIKPTGNQNSGIAQWMDWAS